MKTAAERQRRRRERRATGRRVFRIEADAAVLADLFVSAGLMGEWDADDPAAVEAVLQQVVDRLKLTHMRHA